MYSQKRIYRKTPHISKIISTAVFPFFFAEHAELKNGAGFFLGGGGSHKFTNWYVPCNCLLIYKSMCLFHVTCTVNRFLKLNLSTTTIIFSRIFVKTSCCLIIFLPAISTSFGIFGPFVALILGGVFGKIPVNLKRKSDLISIF